jgi:hypothetical protein
MRAALWVVMVVACNDVHGVAVLVHPNNSDVRYVRLFIGTGGSVMTDLTPDSGVTAGSAYYTTRDPGNDCDTCDVIPVTTDVVKFGFVTDAPVPVVIAVGYDAQKQPIVAGLAHDLAPSDQSNNFFGYELDLAPFQAFSATSSPLQLDLWSPPEVAADPFHARCAGIIDATADHPYFVVRVEDQDCDGLADGTPGECTPDTYLGSAPPDAADATCLVSETTKCRLGGMACVDNGGTAPACSPSETCLPTNLCGECMDDYACAAQILSAASVNSTTTAHYSCTVFLAGDGTVCPVPLALDRPPTGGYDCTGIRIADATTQLTDKITQGNVTITASEHIGTATSCAATLSFEGLPTTPSSLSGLIAFTLNNNAGIALPVTVEFQTGGCTQQTPCALGPPAFDETLTACATAWTGPSVAVELPATDNPESSDPTLTPDQKQMFYESAGRIIEVTKSNNIWGLTASAPLTGNVTDRAPELSGDGLSLVLSSTDVARVTRLYVATRPDLASPFAMATAITGLDPTVFSSATFAPDDSAGNHHMIAAGVANSNPTSTLFDLQLDPTDQAIVLETSIPIDVQNISHPHLTPDGFHLYFDGVSNGTTSLYVASRRTIAEPFRAAVRLGELDDPQDALNQTSGAWVGPGGHTMYYTHAVAGVAHIYQTSRATF